MKTKFQPGDWIIATGGIGQVVRSEQIYAEEFDMDDALSIGDPVKVYVFYKLLCDFEGKLRKRYRLQMAREKSCQKPRAKDAKLIEKIRSSSPVDFAKFEEASETLGILNGIEYAIPKDQLESTYRKLQEAINRLPTPFTYPDFMEACKNQGLNPIGEKGESIERNLEVRLYNEWGKTRDKRRLFTEAQVLKIQPRV